MPAIPATAGVTPERLAAARRAVVSSSIGAALEWFDIIVYASFAIVIAENFFPEGDSTLGLILTFATFAISYLVRPLGGMFLGSYGDRHGRKKALTVTLALMMLGTLIMAIAPTHALIGAWAGIIILISRLIQGFSAGGEFGTATTFLVETAPHRKAYYASWQVAAQGISMFLASAFGFALFSWLTKDQLYSWGWRIPFILGIFIGPVGLYIRSRLTETEEFERSEKHAAPIRAVFSTHLGRLLAASASIGVATISIYLILYMPTFAVKSLHVTAGAAYLGGVVAGLVILVGTPFVGSLADRVGPARLMLWAAVAALVLAWPLFQLIISTPTLPVFILVITALGILCALYFGPLPTLLTEIFPINVRTTGVGVAYNVGVTVMGGLAPLVLTWLLGITGALAAPSFYYMAVAVISLIGLAVAKQKYHAR
ncbi:MFS transporter [Sinomonas atrocyanea]|uniref:MFS transporter n=1 Tax=Sinomonas atrocyanea TaxID=37927 RepID=UPI002865C42A|nr:MFS transporter [Sinomonas atrocyanea]MDR6620180.1 MHS family proline/betaine transporter-like MFS transporter [Sinomonas atrocyanea]